MVYSETVAVTMTSGGHGIVYVALALGAGVYDGFALVTVHGQSVIVKVSDAVAVLKSVSEPLCKQQVS